jgi:succinate dehydrogenase/fumarate reductase flavoprotein subunit
MSLEIIVECDVLVVGGGVAGFFAAIKSRETRLNVVLVEKNYAAKSGATIAAPGFWGIFNPEWGHNLDKAIDETNKKSEYINNRQWTEIILKDSWGTYRDLVSWGSDFPVPEDQRKDFDLININRGRRPVADQNTGSIPLRRRAYQPAMRRQALKDGVKILDRIMVTDLLKNNDKIAGAIGFSLDSNDIYIFKTKAVILCGGGNSFRPPGFKISCLTGDADAMAYRAGAEITGKEFPDLHFNLANYPAWRGADGLYAAYWHFTDAKGEVLKRAPSLNHAFAIHEGRGPVIWDFDAATEDDLKAMDAYTWKQNDNLELERVGFSPRKRGKYPIIGGSSAGFPMCQTSGVWPIDTHCSSTIEGLFAAGDGLGTWAGLFWGLSSAAVTGSRAAIGASEYAAKVKMPDVDQNEVNKAKEVLLAPTKRAGGYEFAWVTQLLQNTMMPYFILHIKSGPRLEAALTLVEFLRDHMVSSLVARDAHELRYSHETKNMLLNAEMILRSSLIRKESRNEHYREDYPRRDDPNWLAWVKMKKDKNGMSVTKEPIPQKWWPDLTQSYEKRYPIRFPGE